MKRLLRNKRGNWVDIFQYGGEALAIGVLVLFLTILLTSFYNVASTNTELNNSIALERAETAKTDFPKTTDFIVPLMYIFVVGFTVWSARLINSSHKLAFIGFIVLLLLVLFSMAIETMWDEFVSNINISPYLSEYPITNFFIANMRYFVLFAGLLTGWALYAKNE